MDAAIAIPNLLHRYAEAFDAGDFEGAARLFDGGAVVAGGRRVAGAEAIVAMWRGWVRLHADGTPRTRHLVTNPIIELAEDGRTARCRSQWTVIQAADGFPLQLVASGAYRDRFARNNGGWRFVERDYGPVHLAGDTSAHLKRDLSKGNA